MDFGSGYHYLLPLIINLVRLAPIPRVLVDAQYGARLSKRLNNYLSNSFILLFWKGEYNTLINMKQKHKRGD